MGTSYSGGSTTQRNIEFSFTFSDKDKAKAFLADFGKAIRNVMSGVDITPYLKDQLELIKDLEKAYADLEKQQNSPEAANRFIRIVNALKATGLQDLKSQFKNLDIDGMLLKAAEAANQLGNELENSRNYELFNANTIKNFRDGIALLKASGVDVSKFLTGVSKDSVSAQEEVEVLTKKIAELEEQLRVSDTQKIKELESQVKVLRDSIVSQFSGWLEAAGFDKVEIGKALKGIATSDAGRDMARLFEEIQTGAKSVKQAASEMGTKWARTIELMTGKPVGQIVGQADSDAVQNLNSRIDELTEELRVLKANAQAGGEAVHQAIENSEQSVGGMQRAVGSIDTVTLKDLLSLLKEIVSESSEFTEGVSASKSAAISFLESLSSVGNIEADKLQNIAAALNSLRNIINPISQSKGSTSGLSSIAAFAERIDKLSRPANLSILSGVNLQGFKEIGASKTLEYITNFISAVSTADLTGLKTLDDSLKSLGNVKISGNYAKLAAAISELNKLTSAKSKTFQNLQNLDLNKTFDISNVVGNADALKSMAESAEKYAEALRTISALQKNVDKLVTGASGSAIGEKLSEIESAKAALDGMFGPANKWQTATTMPNYKSQMDAMWAENERGAKAYADSLDLAKTKLEEMAESARNAEQAEEDALAAAAAKETAAWDKAEDARYEKEQAAAAKERAKAEEEANKNAAKYIKDRAAAFRDLVKATEEARKAEVEQAKYTGDDKERIDKLGEYVRLTKERVEAAREKADAYREDADAAELLANTEAKLAAIDTKYDSKIDRITEGRERSEAAKQTATANAIEQAWKFAYQALERYNKELSGTTNQPVRERLQDLEFYKNELNNARNLDNYDDADVEYYAEVRQAMYATVEEVRILNDELQKVGGNASGVRELESATSAVGTELSRVSKSIVDWDEAFGKGNKYSDQAGQIQLALSKLNEEAGKDGIAVDDLKQRLSALKAEFASLSGEVNKKLSSGLFIEGARAQTDAINKIDVAISNLKKDMAGMGAARTGKTSENYKALEDSINQYEQLRIKVDECTISEDEFKQEFSNIAGSVRINTNAIKSAGEATGTFAQKLKSVAGVLQSWISPMRIIQYVIRTTRQMISTSIELDSAMTQLRVVTKASGDEMERFGDKAAASAKKIGASMTDLINSATVFARLGYSLEESASLAEYTTMLQNVGNIDVADAQNAVTAIFKAFKDLDIDDIESVMDRLVVVGNNFPISVSQIAEGMNNASSTLAAAGNSFDESVALLTAANTTIQNAAKASTGLRTITARLRNTTADLEELGEDMTEAKYDELIQALTKAHVRLTDLNGEYRSTYEIMKDIASVWGDMSSMEQAALATAVSGKIVPVRIEMCA